MEKKEQITEAKASAKLLDGMYKNVRMGADSILELIPKVEDEKMRHELVYQLGRYEEFSNKLKNMLSTMGEAINDEGTLAKFGTKMSVAVNTMIDSTPSHIAEMMIQGGTMGVTDATKLLREYENSSCSEEALAITRKIIKFEESTIERLKSFL